MIRRTRIVVTGTVQGVFFRHHTRRKAGELRLAGTVRNLPDGSVEVVCEGDERQIQKLIEWCGLGPDSACVAGVDVRWDEASGSFTGFTILY